MQVELYQEYAEQQYVSFLLLDKAAEDCYNNGISSILKDTVVKHKKLLRLFTVSRNKMTVQVQVLSGAPKPDKTIVYILKGGLKWQKQNDVLCARSKL